MKALAADRFQVGPARDEDNRVSRLSEAPTKIAADAPSTENRNPHHNSITWLGN